MRRPPSVQPWSPASEDRNRQTPPSILDQSKLETMGRTNSLKRRRQSSANDEDIENIMPPAKQAFSRLHPGYSGETGAVTSSPLQPSGEDGRSSATSSEIVDSTDDPAAEFADLGSEESSPQYLTSISNGVLSSLDNFRDSNALRKQSKRSPPPCEKKCPFPNFTWADPRHVWKRMYERDAAAAELRSADMLDYHPGLKFRMRAILLDWLNEVCDVYKLHRESFHLCVNYIDRFLSATTDVHKNRLQLIGITCLFIAAKVEEVYPPKIAEFAYVTDGACTKEDILLEEIVILTTLQWSISPITTNHWLNMYLQLSVEKNPKRQSDVHVYDENIRNNAFLFTQYSSLNFIICAQLVDLALLHVGVNAFKYSQLAAAAIGHIFKKEIALEVSGYSWEDLEPCYDWLAPFAKVLSEPDGGQVKISDSMQTLPDSNNANTSSGLSHICPNMNPDQSHRIQVHNVSLDYFDKVNLELTNINIISASPTRSNNRRQQIVRNQTPLIPSQ